MWSQTAPAAWNKRLAKYARPPPSFAFLAVTLPLNEKTVHSCCLRGFGAKRTF
jgi:hypothetical protein